MDRAAHQELEALGVTDEIIQALPPPISISLASLKETFWEPHATAKRLKETIEISLRVCAAVAFAEVLARRQPRRVLEQLARQFVRRPGPSMGGWLRFLLDCLKCTDASPAAGRLRHVFLAGAEQRAKPSELAKRIEQSFIAWRNVRDHGVAPREHAEAQRDIVGWLSLLSSMALQLREVFSGSKFSTPAGQPAKGSTLRDVVLCTREGETLQLGPLLCARENTGGAAEYLLLRSAERRKAIWRCELDDVLHARVEKTIDPPGMANVEAHAPKKIQLARSIHEESRQSVKQICRSAGARGGPAPCGADLISF